MTTRSSARIAGIVFLVYIAAGLFGLARSAGPLASVVLSFLMIFSALILGVTLYSITKAEDGDLALLGLVCRIGEGVLTAAFLSLQLALRASIAGARASGADAAPEVAVLIASARNANTLVGAALFAVGSAVFAWLFLRGRMIPLALAWLGVLASLLLVVVLPLQLAGVVRGAPVQLVWLPMLAFEVPLAIWLITRGIRA